MGSTGPIGPGLLPLSIGSGLDSEGGERYLSLDPVFTVAPRPGCHPGLSLFSHAIDFASDVLCLSASSTKRSISSAEYLTDFPNFVKLGPKPFHRQAWSVETDTFNRSATCCSFKKTFIAFLQGKISIQPITIDAIDAPIA